MNLELNKKWAERFATEDKPRRKDFRSPTHRDRARILHSAAFRRLQGKTQVLTTGQNDFYRTRLTHSLEASQIGSGIVSHLKKKQPEFNLIIPSFSLIESLTLSHDIGHPPFGHGGEIALNYMMRNHGNFEGNAQTFRIVSKLEMYTPNNGMNLTRRTLLGLLKYPALLNTLKPKIIPKDIKNRRQLKAKDWLPTKGIYQDENDVFNWIIEILNISDQEKLKETYTNCSTNIPLKTRFKSLDASIMELADDIAYAIHDLEDAIVLKIISKNQWEKELATVMRQSDTWLAKHTFDLIDNLFADEHYKRKDAIGSLVNAFITAISIQKSTLDSETSFNESLLKYNAVLDNGMDNLLTHLKRFVNEYVVQQPDVQRLEYKGQQLIMALFETFSADPERLLPYNTKKRWLNAQDNNSKARIICDYIAGMTDYYAQKVYADLNLPLVYSNNR